MKWKWEFIYIQYLYVCYLQDVHHALEPVPRTRVYKKTPSTVAPDQPQPKQRRQHRHLYLYLSGVLMLIEESGDTRLADLRLLDPLRQQWHISE